MEYPERMENVITHNSGNYVDRAPTVRPQRICQSVTAQTWLDTATTVQLGGVGFWMDWQQNANSFNTTSYPNSLMVVALRYNQALPTRFRGVAMSTADTYVRARIDTATKKRAADALEAMGLSIADAMRT